MEVLKPSIPCLLLFVLFTYSDIFIGKTVGEGVTPDEAKQLRDEVRGMFYHAFNGYMEHAFPRDELRPLSCEGEDTLGGYALTLIDSLDMLALLGDRERFASSVEWIGKNLRFDINKTVSVFETTIRILGGLLSAHLIASDYATGMKIPSYDDQLLHLSEDLARRLLPAFDTPTGIPFGSVNLLHGVDEHESKITSTAGGGTLTLEFGVLSRLTNDPIFEEVTKKAVRGLWARRSKLNLVGAHIDVFSGEWTQKDAGIGTSIDSFYEYLLKAYLLFGDEEYLFIFQEAYGAAMQYLHTDPWYVEVNMDSAAIVWPLFNSLQAFWPGLQVLAGDIDPAIRTHTAFFSVWKRYGFTPEGFNLATLSVQHGQKSYPLRPELMESTYWLYKATRDPRYLDAGRDMVASLQYGAQCPCGYCHISDVEFHSQEDHMESFFLAETVKYLWLLFDLAADPDNLVENGPYKYIFSTEGHLLPTTPQISLVREHCSYFGAYCKNGNLSWESLTSDTSTDSQGINGSKFFKSWSSTSYPSDDPFHEFTSGMIKGFCPGLSHGQKFGISYRASADTSHEDKSPSQSETSVVHSSSVVVISNPKAEDLPSDRIHDKVEELSEEGSEREPHQVQSSLVVVISNPKTEDLLSDRIHDKVEELNEEDSEGEPHQVQSNSVVIISNPKAEDLQSDRVHDKVEELSEEGSESEPHQVQSSSMMVISTPKAEDLQSDRVHDKVEELSEEGSESEPHQVSGRPIG